MPDNDVPLTNNNDLLTIVRAGNGDADTTQTHNARRVTGIGAENSPADGFWVGKVFTGPGEVSGAHHHGDSQTAGYVLKGRAFIRYGERYESVVYLDEGDFLYVPPNMPHIEGNASDTEELVWLTTRIPGNTVVNLSDQDVADVAVGAGA